MKRYLAIGHFYDSKNMTSAALKATSIKSFRDDLAGNGFIPFVVISERKLNILKNANCFQLFEEIKKMTTNYRKWNDLYEYIEQCFDIMEERMMNA